MFIGYFFYRTIVSFCESMRDGSTYDICLSTTVPIIAIKISACLQSILISKLFEPVLYLWFGKF